MCMQYLHPLTSAVAHVAVGSSSVCQPVTAACIVPALPAAACAAAMPRHQVPYYHSSNKSVRQQAFGTLKSLTGG